MTMNTKMTSAIEQIALNSATFTNVDITPTLINFFFGNNGTGKTTMLRILVDELTARECNYKLLASTGRAAKIMSNIKICSLQPKTIAVQN